MGKVAAGRFFGPLHKSAYRLMYHCPEEKACQSRRRENGDKRNNNQLLLLFNDAGIHCGHGHLDVQHPQHGVLGGMGVARSVGTARFVLDGADNAQLPNTLGIAINAGIGSFGLYGEGLPVHMASVTGLGLHIHLGPHFVPAGGNDDRALLVVDAHHPYALALTDGLNSALD